MKITHYGHACVLIETGTARILFDPGTLSHGFEELRDLTAILVTHNHDDHLDAPRLAELVAANPGAVLVSDAESAEAIGAQIAVAGTTIDLGGATATILGGVHAPIVDAFPGSGNVSYLIDHGAFLHPGDSFDVPEVAVDVLALPTSGPWTKLGDAIRYMREVKPRIAVPIHEAALASTMPWYGMLAGLSPEGTTFTQVELGVPTEV